jgi:hypothetical protein
VSKNAGRSTTGDPKVPYYLSSPHIEAAKHLRLTVTRYINERANLNDVEEAMVMLRSAAPVKGDRGHREGKK